MEFKKGDMVECWDDGSDEDNPYACEYFAFNDHPRASLPHLARKIEKNGDIRSFISSFAYCRPIRPKLKMDDPVWVRMSGDLFYPHHFAGWIADGRMKFWAYGKTSHTVDSRNHWYVAEEYRLTPPDSDEGGQQ